MDELKEQRRTVLTDAHIEKIMGAVTSWQAETTRCARQSETLFSAQRFRTAACASMFQAESRNPLSLGGCFLGVGQPYRYGNRLRRTDIVCRSECWRCSRLAGSGAARTVCVLFFHQLNITGRRIGEFLNNIVLFQFWLLYLD